MSNQPNKTNDSAEFMTNDQSQTRKLTSCMSQYQAALPEATLGAVNGVVHPECS